jgi:DNA-directed RNA polymerase subunit M/transcription elongation factor TFIIS
MARLDGVEESRRLQELYARLTDDELQAVADDGYELTDVAKQTLQAEILGRGLHIQLRDSPSTPGFNEEKSDFDPSDLDLVVARRVWDLSEARQAKSILDDARIPSFLGPNNLDGAEESKLNFENGVDLKVREVDSQLALQALSQALPPEAQDDVDYVPVCPKCHSSEIVFQNLDTTQNSSSAFDAKFNWSCDACGYQWKDDGIEAQA